MTNTSTLSPTVSMPPTARSSETVIEMARHGAVSGPKLSSGVRIENGAPSVADASMLVVTSWPWRIVTAAMRPMTRFASVMTPFALVGSSGTSRTVTSAALTGSRAGIVATATTRLILLVVGSFAFCWAWLIV